MSTVNALKKSYLFAGLLQRKSDRFASRLLKWAEYNRREFPWRKRPDAYHVLIAEELLRKTSARQVQSVYQDFLRKFRNPRALAKATPSEIEKVIRPLGMERQRSATLHKFGVAVVEQFQGKIPLSRDKLLALPGVGEYAADAVLSFVAGERVPMVDRNAVRVISRIFSIRLPSNYRKAVKTIRDFLMPIVRKYGGAEFNFGLLDFAAAICTARNPKCPICPMRSFCDYAAGLCRSETTVNDQL